MLANRPLRRIHKSGAGGGAVAGRDLPPPDGPAAGRSRCSCCVALVVWLAQTTVAGPLLTAAPAAEPGLLACYRFDEGSGTALADHSGNGHHGTIHNARWVRSAERRGLAFGDADSYVDCGVELGRKLTADMTILAWVRLDATPYPDNSTNWTLVDCEEHTRSGFLVRIDGQSTKLYYRANAAGRVPQAFSAGDVRNGPWHHLAVTRQGTRVTLFLDGLADTSFTAEPPALPTARFTISNPGQPLRGTIGDMAIYGRALARDEVLQRYKSDAAAHGKDTSWFGTFRLEPFLYLDRAQATVAVDFLGVLPMPAGSKATVELGPPGGAALRSIEAAAIPESGKQDFTFSLTGLPQGRYEIRTVLRDGSGKATALKATEFSYPPDRIAVPSPARQSLPPLPGRPQLPPPTILAAPGGGFVVRAGVQDYAIASEFSYPGDGFHTLGAAPAHGDASATAPTAQSALGNGPSALGAGLPTPPKPPTARSPSAPGDPWRPTIRRLSPSAFQVTATCPFYGLSRDIEVQPTRVLVRDRLTNRTAEPLGILVRHHLAPPPAAAGDLYLGGYRCGGDLAPRTIRTNPTVFLAGKESGVGLVALDDVLIVQSMATAHRGAPTLHSDTFALDRGASYTLEWAVYPSASGDYYDFINQVRRDEGRNGRIDGGVGFITRAGTERSAHRSHAAIDRAAKHQVLDPPLPLLCGRRPGDLDRGDRVHRLSQGTRALEGTDRGHAP